jgi:GNAT superfamily N-acetyltransferase
MHCRALRHDDLPGVLALQEANLHANLSEPERAGGFLSARFGAEQFIAMAGQVGVMVATASERVVGYACASEVDFNRRFPLLAAMIDAFPRTPYRGGMLDRATCFVYGPVCVDRAWRGRGVLRGLVNALREHTAGRFDCGVAFIARDNQRSLVAHVQGLGLLQAGEFEHDGRAYHLVVLPA